jgi:hypothetical protein
VPVGEFDRDIRPAVLALIRGVIERHAPQETLAHSFVCSSCFLNGRAHLRVLTYFPCADYLAAENALGVGDE